MSWDRKRELSSYTLVSAVLHKFFLQQGGPQAQDNFWDLERG